MQRIKNPVAAANCIESILAENPDLQTHELYSLCSEATTLIIHNPRISSEDLSDTLEISEYTAQQLTKLIDIFRQGWTPPAQV